MRSLVPLGTPGLFLAAFSTFVPYLPNRVAVNIPLASSRIVRHDAGPRAGAGGVERPPLATMLILASDPRNTENGRPVYDRDLAGEAGETRNKAKAKAKAEVGVQVAHCRSSFIGRFCLRYAHVLDGPMRPIRIVTGRKRTS
jgi:hypothetical protein